MTAAAARMAWMDLIRGAAILLVLGWHAPAVPTLFGYGMPAWVQVVNDALLPFRMPTLMVLSGMLLPRALAKPLPTYYRGKLRNLIWPYLLWAALHMALMGATAPVWHPNAWVATGYLWFLAFVAYYYLAAPLLRRVPAWLISLATFAGATVATSPLPHRVLYFAGFFFAGAWFAQHPGWVERVVARRWVVVGCAGVAAMLAAASAVVDVELDPRFAVGSLAGVVVAVAVAHRVQGAAWARPVRSIGRHSLVYYVSHFPVMLGVLALAELVEAPALAPVVGFVAALVVGAVLVRWRDVGPVSWLFEAPGRRRRPPTVAGGVTAGQVTPVRGV